MGACALAYYSTLDCGEAWHLRIGQRSLLLSMYYVVLSLSLVAASRAEFILIGHFPWIIAIGPAHQDLGRVAKILELLSSGDSPSDAITADFSPHVTTNMPCPSKLLSAENFLTAVSWLATGGIHVTCSWSSLTDDIAEALAGVVGNVLDA